MRKRLWQLHAWLGLFAGIGLLVIGLTGSMLVFRDEIDGRANPAATRVAPHASGRLPLDRLLADVQRQLPDHRVTGWRVRPPEEAGRADVLYLLRRGTDVWHHAMLDPFTGQLLTGPQTGTATFTGWVLELHYALLADHAGAFAAGLLGGVLCVLGLTGLWLHREFWKHLLTLRWRRGARILFSDLHKTIGVASVGCNLLLGFTGAYWNITHILGHWLGVEPDQPRLLRPLHAATLSADAMVREAAERIPGFRANFLSFPTQPGAGVTLYGAVPSTNPFRGPYGSVVEFDPRTGALRSTFDLRAAGAWAQLVDSFRPLHFGTFGGLPVKILWALGGLAPGALAVTGAMIAWSRRRSRPRPVTPARRAPLPAESSPV